MRRSGFGLMYCWSAGPGVSIQWNISISHYNHIITIIIIGNMKVYLCSYYSTVSLKRLGHWKISMFWTRVKNKDEQISKIIDSVSGPMPQRHLANMTPTLYMHLCGALNEWRIWNNKRWIKSEARDDNKAPADSRRGISTFDRGFPSNIEAARPKIAGR